MALHTVRAADDQDRVVQHLQYALCLAAEVPVSRRVQQRHLLFAQSKTRLLGKYRDPAIAFDLVMVQKSVFMIDSALRPRYAGQI